MIVSPVKSSSKVRLLQQFRSKEICDRWARELGIDIADEMVGCELIEMFECEESKVRFFAPAHVAGSGNLYAKLEHFDWYYADDRWEHAEAMRDLRADKKIIEIGCGSGAFLKRLRKAGIAAEGIEINSEAIKAGVEAGLTVTNVSLGDLAMRVPGTYQAVCSFQVLEHVPQPGIFIQNMIDLLEVGGKLIVAVPNCGSFLQHLNESLLNLPPHHMSHWTSGSMERLPKLFPIKLFRVTEEPLHRNHVAWYLDSQFGRLTTFLRLRSIAYKALFRPLLWGLSQSGWMRARLKGHSLYACFEKTASLA